MKIALLSRWNTACVVSLHAELIGREWVRRGHELVVFAPNNIRPVREDEDYVIRCYSDEGDRTTTTRTFFHPEPLLEKEYEVLVAERLEWVPLKPLKEIFPEVRRKAKTVYVIHERRPPENPLFYEFEWDAVVCFDERYERQWAPIFGEKLHVIPFPTGPLKRGDRLEARRRLGLPPESRIVFSYGWAPELHILPVLPSMERLSEEFEFTYLVLTPRRVEGLEGRAFVEVRHEMPPMERIYEYLHASDICLIHKEAREVREGEVVISTSVLMCMGALTPIVTADTEFVRLLGKEVIKYRSPADLERTIAGIFRSEIDVEETLRAAERYVVENSPERIASEFLKLFDEL